MAFAVAIDGPAAAGKGTIGRAIANRFGFEHLDTGLLYRAVAKLALASAANCSEEMARAIAARLNPKDIEKDGLRTTEVSRESSRIAAMPSVRAALLEFQRNFAQRKGGAVLDGRDIATVIVPNADVKLFVTATEGVRACRRQIELTNLGMSVSYDDVLDDLRRRDERDTKRGLAALRRADDSLLIDTSELTIQQAVSMANAAVNQQLGNRVRFSGRV